MNYLGKKGVVIYSVVFAIFILTIFVLAFYYTQFKKRVLAPTKSLWQEMVYHPNPQLWRVKLNTKIFSDPRFLNLKNNFVDLSIHSQDLGNNDFFVSEQKNSSSENETFSATNVNLNNANASSATTTEEKNPSTSSTENLVNFY